MKRFTIRTLGSFSFFKNIEYIANDCNGCIIFMEKENYYIKERLNYVMNYLCNIYLTSFKTYRKTIKMNFEYCYKAPLVLSSKTIFFFTKGFKNYDNISINYKLIKTVKKTNEGFKIIFESGNKLYLDISINSYYKTVLKIETINEYLSNSNY